MLLAAYDGPPECKRCGGRLAFAFETCSCGGRSQYVTGAPARRDLPGLAAALAQLEARRDPPC